MTQMDVLEKIFGSAAKVKIMRLFLFNQNEIFDAKTVVERTKVSASLFRREVNALESIGMVITRKISKSGKKSVQGWALNSKFKYVEQLKDFLIRMNPLSKQDLINKTKRLGSVKLLVTAGVFIQDPESRVDLLIVGDKIKKGSADNIVKTIEAEIGKELKYAVFETEDFKYRLSMYDKLIRDILDFPHNKVIDKINIPHR